MFIGEGRKETRLKKRAFQAREDEKKYHLTRVSKSEEKVYRRAWGEGENIESLR